MIAPVPIRRKTDCLVLYCATEQNAVYELFMEIRLFIDTVEENWNQKSK
jgi:hypothetical protein